MDDNQIASKEVAANNATVRISGTPSIAELKRRVEMKQLKKTKSGSRKKSPAN